MKKILMLCIGVSLIMVAPVFAETHYTVDKLVNKGAMEIVKAPFHYYDSTVSEIKDAKNPAIGFLTSLFTAPLHVVKKVGEGSVSMATFLIE